MRLKKFFKAIVINLKTIVLLTCRISSVLFSFIAVVLSFISWDDIGKLNVCQRLFCFLLMIIISLIISFFIIVIIRSRKIWENGTGKLSIIYGDIIKIGFSKKKNELNRIIVIPVNTHFDTKIDESLSDTNKPLVSLRTIHGKWMSKIFDRITQDELNTKIMSNLNQQCVPFCDDAMRVYGNKREYPTGTIAIIPGENKVTFFLLALSKFDENNNAQCDDDSFIQALRELIRFYDAKGQGYAMYLPLVGTNLSRAGLSHKDALNKIVSIMKLESNQIHGQINIVIYNEDKDKVSIW